MSDNAITAQGTKVQMKIGSPGTYTDIPEIKSFNGPGGSAAVIDVTDLLSTAKEKRMGLQDHGQLGFNVNFLPQNAVHKALMEAKSSGEKQEFKIIFTDDDTTEWTFDGFVLSMATSGGVDAVVESAVTVEISGDIEEV